jgi:hypothetical protein
VMVVLKVPVGKKVRFDESVANRLHPFTIRINRSEKWNRYRNDVDFDYDDNFDYDTNVDYIMTEDGLRRLDTQGNIVPEENTDDKKGNKNENDSIQQEPGNQPDTQRYRYKRTATKEIADNHFKDPMPLQPITINVF